MPAHALSVHAVNQTYRGGHRALQDMSLQLRLGVLGLLGPNGAGKSTLMRILATLTKPTSGTVTWNGHDIAKEPDRLRAVLGYLPQDFGVYDALNAREFLAFLAAVKGIGGKAARTRIEACLEMVGLADTGDRRLGQFSGGMRQRVGIAQALLNDPALLIVDEPTVGLDPDERLRFQHLITDLAKPGSPRTSSSGAVITCPVAWSSFTKQAGGACRNGGCSRRASQHGDGSLAGSGWILACFGPVPPACACGGASSAATVPTCPGPQSF